MADEQTVAGLTLCKINGIYHLDVRNATWSVKKANVQHPTGKGIQQATGLEVPSCTFDEVIPRQKGLDWRSLKNFSVEILDKEEKNVLFSGTTGNWTSIDGTSDTGQASTTKRIGVNLSDVVKV